MTTKDMILKRLREIHFALIDLDKNPVHSYPRNKLLWEQKVLRKLLIEGIEQ